MEPGQEADESHARSSQLLSRANHSIERHAASLKVHAAVRDKAAGSMDFLRDSHKGCLSAYKLQPDSLSESHQYLFDGKGLHDFAAEVSTMLCTCSLSPH